ncbi:hypothetical protein SASPL_138326 [Salvia splendens]|uniref:Uncharacterized protein n=1 Tax=Salvia splendens TaxID=180675 RepID=A0A8X8WWG5_SALSN|nr:hypothetical protein SASPL_138326 [Salvia splendens]
MLSTQLNREEAATPLEHSARRWWRASNHARTAAEVNGERAVNEAEEKPPLPSFNLEISEFEIWGSSNFRKRNEK